MKKIILFTALATLFLGSCKKDSKSTTTTTTNTTTTFSVTIGGVTESFAGNVTGEISNSTSGSGQTLLISGLRGTGTTQESLTIGLNSNTTLSKGVYTINSTNNSEANYPAIAYFKNISSSDPLSFGTDVTGTNVTTLTINSISSTNVQGTFSAVLVDEGGGSDTQTLTNGMFNVSVTTK